MRFSSYQEWSVGIAISWCPCEAREIWWCEAPERPQNLSEAAGVLDQNAFCYTETLAEPRMYCGDENRTIPSMHSPNLDNKFGCNTQPRGSDFATGCSALTSAEAQGYVGQVGRSIGPTTSG